MDAAAGRHVGCRDVQKRNDLLRSSASNVQVVAAIHHFVGETVNLRFSKKIYKKNASNAYGEQARCGILPKAAVEHVRGHRKREQRGGGEPDTALEQDSILERDGSHFRGYSTRPVRRPIATITISRNPASAYL